MNMPSKTEPGETKENIQYFKLSFIGIFFYKLQKLTKQFGKEGTNIKIFLSNFKLAALFSTKDK